MYSARRFVLCGGPLALLSLLLSGWMLAATGCDAPESTSPPTFDHPAAERVRSFLQAIQYRDVERAYQLHVESTEQGIYCSSDSFKKVLERTRKRKTKTDCRDARKLSDRRRAALENDAELLVQILRFTCEQPDGDCRDYARRVFTSQWPESRLWQRLDDFELKRVDPRDGEAVVYVDVVRKHEGTRRVFHRSLTLKRYGGEWYVADQPGRARDDADRPDE
jgi:hypothetical protein